MRRPLVSRFALFVSLFALLCLPISAAEKTYGDVDAKVIAVHDGDTFIVEIPSYPPVCRVISVRVHGIDTPELRGLHQAKAKQAFAFTANLCSNRPVKLIGIRRDKYFRLLASVQVDGKDLAGELLKAGLARPYFGQGPKPW